jgi:hypothetical protein
MVRVSEGRKAFLNVLCQKCGTATEWGIAIREFYYLASAAAIATMVAGFAVPASAQPFSSVMGSWGYGGYGAFHMVLWVLIVIAFILGVVWRVWHGTRRNGGGVVGPAAAGRTNAHGGVAKTRTIKGPTNRRPKSK